MSWFSKKLKKITKVIDPIGAKLRKQTGGSYGDPLNMYQSKPKAVTPYQRPERPGLQADPGTGGPTMQLGGPGGGQYTQNPFAGQMAQAQALRAGGQLGQSGPQIPPPGGITPRPGGMMPRGNAMVTAGQNYMADQGNRGQLPPAPQGQNIPGGSGMQIPRMPQRPMMF